MEHDPRYPLAAPGWQALDQRLSLYYPGQVPYQYTSQTPYELEQNNPLPAVSIYEAEAPRHFHYVTYGLTELFEKTSPREDISGFGFELCFRVQRDVGELSTEPPTWAVRVLQSVGHYVLSGHALDSGHCIDFGDPLTSGSQLCGVLCVPDAQLGKIETPHGSVLFLLLVGLTQDELERVQTWPFERKIAWAREAFTEGVTDIHRTSLRGTPLFRRYDLGVLLD